MGEHVGRIAVDLDAACLAQVFFGPPSSGANFSLSKAA
jgi:hypothetical protein